MKTYSKEEIIAIYNKPFLELVHEAAQVHRKYHDSSKIQVSTLISIKTGGCPEDCGYCPQAARYHTEIEKNELLPVSTVMSLAKQAKANGSSRVCMGAAWRNVKEGDDFDQVLEMVRGISQLDMEVCCTLGMVTENQARQLAEEGKAIVWIDAGMHATERACGQMAPELMWRIEHKTKSRKNTVAPKVY